MSEEYKERENAYSYENLVDAYKNRKVHFWSGTAGCTIYAVKNKNSLLLKYAKAQLTYGLGTCLLISGMSTATMTYYDNSTKSEEVILSSNGFGGAKIEAIVDITL